MAVVQDLFEFATRLTTPPPEPVVEEVVEEIEDGDLQETQAMPWTPQFDRTGDLDGRLRAKGRLLSRAFGFDDVDLDHDQQHPEY